jgi:hypothetical protein
MENNPYAPPKSHIEIDNEFKRSIWWKLYFYPITILMIIGSISVLKEKSAGFVDYLMLASDLVAIVGFYGFVHLKRFLSPKYWMVFFVIYLLFNISYEFLTNVDLQQGMSDKQYYISMLGGYIISLPLYYALYSYGKKSNPIWVVINVKRDSIPTKMLYIFGANFIGGVIIYPCIGLYIRYSSSDVGNALFLPEYGFLLLALFSLIFALLTSYQYNKDIAHPLYHPIFLFFKLLFSKHILLPTIFFPLGAFFSHLACSFISQQDMWRSISFIGIRMLFFLCVISMLGSFVGTFISNRKLSPSL